ncbi:MAG: hypothetical protein WD645_03575 [Dehalococcoidia bacterium]
MANKVFYLATHATDDPTKATLPLVGAVGAHAADIECSIGLLGEGAALIRDSVANSVNGVGFAPFSELLAQVIEAKVPIYV